MATRTVTLKITGSTAELNAALEAARLKTEETSAAMGDHLANASEKAAGGFSKLGNAIQNATGIPVAAIFDKISEKFSNLDSKGQKFGQTMSTIGGVTLAAGAVGFIAVADGALHMADAFDTAQASLQTAVKNSGASWSQFSGPIDDAYGKMAKLGFNSTETAGALTSLTTATGSPTKAINDLGLAADLARLKHISLSDAAGILTKTLAGSTRGLTQLGLNLDIGSAKASALHNATQTLTTAQQHLTEIQQKVADGSLKGVAAQQALENAQRSVQVASENLSRDQKAGGDILDALKKKTEGAAAAYGQTLPGQMAIARAEVHNLGTQFGEFLVPKITDAMKAVESIVGWFEKHKAVAEALGAVIGGVLAIAIAAFAINTGVKMVKSVQSAVGAIQSLIEKIPEFISGLTGAGAAEEEFATTSEATGTAASAAFGPIGLAIMAIVVIGTLIVTHWTQVKAALLAVWNGIKDAAIAVWDFIKDHIKLVVEAIVVLLTGGLGALAIVIYNNWNKIKGDVVAVWGDIVNFFTGIPGKILSALSSLGSAIAGVATSAWNAFKNAVVAGWNDEVSFWTGLPGKVVSALGSGLKVLEQWGKDIIQGAINGIEAMAGDVLHALESLVTNAINIAKNAGPSIGGVSLNPLHYLAEGGIIMAPTLAVVGESGPEIVMPLSKFRGLTEVPEPGALPPSLFGPTSGSTSPTSSLSPTGSSSGNMVNQSFTFNVESPASPTDLAHAVSVAMRIHGVT